MKLYPNPQMPQRGGWWPDCLGVIVIAFVAVGAGVFFAIGAITGSI